MKWTDVLACFAVVATAGPVFAQSEALPPTRAYECTFVDADGRAATAVMNSFSACKAWAAGLSAKTKPSETGIPWQGRYSYDLMLYDQNGNLIASSHCTYSSPSKIDCKDGHASSR